MIDRDDSGFVDFDEYKVGLQLVAFLEKREAEGLPAEAVMRKWFDDADADKNGFLDLPEFAAVTKIEMAWRKDPSSHTTTGYPTTYPMSSLDEWTEEPETGNHIAYVRGDSSGNYIYWDGYTATWNSDPQLPVTLSE